MTLAHLKEFRDAGFERHDTGVALVWAKSLTDDPDEYNCIIVYSEVRSELGDTRPQDEWEPCAFYRFDGLEAFEQGRADTPLATLELAKALAAS